MNLSSNGLLARLTGVLSIGKVGLARDQQLYYEQKVARGAEDYYAGRGETPGRWAGSGAQQLGLAGELDVEQLMAMMDGRHPVTGGQLGARGPRSKTAAFDLTFSAPKSVSVLFAVGEGRLSRALVDAHEEAVDAALTYLEAEACRVRRGHNGTRAEREAGDPRGRERARAERAGGFVAAAYRHRMSRAQDPQLHTHVVCANMAQGGDGRWTALDGTAIYAYARTAGFVYEAHLRHAVRERLPWAEWGPVRNGIAELVQVPESVRAEFSQRRRRILEREAELVAAGVAVGPSGRERIAHATREPKRDVVERDWREEVRARAAEHGLAERELDCLGRLQPAPSPRPPSVRELADTLVSPAGLTARRNSFRARDVVAAVAEAGGQGASAARVLELAEQVLARQEVVAIPAGLERRFTTLELLRAEQRLIEQAEQGRGRAACVLTERQLASGLRGLDGSFSEEQRQVVRAIATSGHRIDTVEALAGAGKTTTAGALRAVYEQAGYRVLGAAPTGRAVRELKDRAGISEAMTLDGWVVKLAADPSALSFAEPTKTSARRQPAVMIIDEAGLAHTRLSAAVIERTLSAGVKVIAIGDSGQLSSVQAGGWLGAVTRRLGSHELREVMRQRDPGERRALADVHRGRPGRYLELKRARGELSVFAGEQPGTDAEQALIDRWAAACDRYGIEQAVMICRDNRRRERLNELARAHLRQRGQLADSVAIAGRTWAVGERVIARRNDRRLDVDNGMRATVTVVEPWRERMIVEVGAGGTRELDREYVKRHLEPAYTLTGHGMQGATVEWAGVIGQAHDFSRNWSYTALSRAREPVEIFLVDEPAQAAPEREEIAPSHPGELNQDALAQMRERMRERDDEDLALEQLEQAGLPPVRAFQADHDPARAYISPGRERVYELERQLAVIHEQREAVPTDDARAIERITEASEAIAQSRQHERGGRWWRVRGERAARERERQRHLEGLHNQRTALMDRVPNWRTVLDRAQQLSEMQRSVASEHLRLRGQAIVDELARTPPWLEETIGLQPNDVDQRGRWQRTAREIAGQRIDRHITDPHSAIDRRAPDRALVRAIADTRLSLGLDSPGHHRDAGYEL